jgi:hypothetical protein
MDATYRTDFGLAKCRDSAASLSSNRSVLLLPAIAAFALASTLWLPTAVAAVDDESAPGAAAEHDLEGLFRWLDHDADGVVPVAPTAADDHAGAFRGRAPGAGRRGPQQPGAHRSGPGRSAPRSERNDPRSPPPGHWPTPGGLDGRELPPGGPGRRPGGFPGQGMPPRGVDGQGPRPGGFDGQLPPRGMDGRGARPGGLQGRGLPPRGFDGRGNRPGGFSGRGMPPRGERPSGPDAKAGPPRGRRPEAGSGQGVDRGREPRQSGRGQERGRQPSPRSAIAHALLRAADADRDGMVTAEEWSALCAVLEPDSSSDVPPGDSSARASGQQH